MKKLNKRLLSLVLAICLVLSLAAPVAAAPAGKVSFTQVDNSAVSADLLTKVDEDINTMEDYVDTDDVRVSIFLEKESTVAAGFSTDSIAANSEAMAYRAGLKENQAKITAAIEQKLGCKLDVVWNLTLAANLISANVKYGQIKAIEAVAGVREVLVETSYEPDVVAADEVSDPNTATSSKQIGSAAAWAAGYTGAGSRIAVIDTGSDTDHQSLNSDAFHYSLAYNAGIRDISIEEYIESLDLLDAEEIAAVADELNAPVGADAYINTKLPFGYNYIDKNLDVTHDNDAQGSHGSHVAGIATANAYVPTDDGFVPALESAMVQGVAPDAQLITMKVFGKKGGAYPSDYMAAIEDAIVLGCDSANLSLGSGNPGMSRETTEEYQAILDSLTDAGIVVAMSAGNAGFWAENAYNAGFLYAEDVSMQTNGSPGSYTNSLSVASVENDGKTGCYFSIGNLLVVYNEMLEGNTGKYSNLPFTTIAGDQEYIFIDGFGTAEDWAAVGSALEGKIALCSRGEISFFEKAQYAVEAGAIATFIYNNQAGVINMDLSSYPYTEPCASLTQADGAAVKAVSTPVTDDAGNVLYYTGTMNISEGLGVGQFNSAYYTMSSFSSWGVPGSLEMKPEITAPGGNIYSINGVDKSGTAYETMSGTSMASPQVAGMAAIVAQYIRENGLAEQTGLSARQLAQSLLMSTAEPMLASATAYHSILQQGAGLANVGAAVSADSYITMADGSSAGAADGKVKVELGDDPARTGSYTATFTINNLTDSEQVIDLGADFFIQAPTSDGVNMYMYTATALIGMNTEWIVDGAAFEPAYSNRDFNGDGIVNADDGQAILDYATGAVETLNNIALADIDADKDVDSYDAYLFLRDLNSAYAFLPAGGSAEVTVNFSMSDDWKATVDYYYPNGTYIQGYLFAQTTSTDEGVAGTVHSIPVLGFFGSWTEASMFDVGCYQTYATGEETRLSYLSSTDHNTFSVTYANEPDQKYYLGGNPLIPDDIYLPERNAINSADIISGIDFVAIRNAADSRYMAVNETTGEVLYEVYPGAVSSAYYYVNGGYWQNIGYGLNLDVDLSSASEGDVIFSGLTLAPEYYVDAEGNVAWDAMASGATLGASFVIDNTAPVLNDVSISLTKNQLVVEASDNEYIAAVALYNKTGTKVLAAAGAKQDIAKGETAVYNLPLKDISGSKFLLQVSDYAMNTTTFVVELSIGGEETLPEMIVFDLTDNFWTTFTRETEFDYTVGMDVYEESDLTFHAGTIVDHMVLAVTDTADLYIMPEKELYNTTYVANIGVNLTDMAYNKADDLVYGVTDTNQLVTIDRLDGTVEVVDEIAFTTNTLACDANGTFYCNELGTSALYSFTLDTIAEPTLLVEDMGLGAIGSIRLQTMEINPNTGMLCWNSYSLFFGFIGLAYYYEYNPSTGEWTKYNDLWDEYTCLLIPEIPSASGSWTAPVNEVTGMQISRVEINLLRGTSFNLFASVQPWNASDRTVTWSSADETIATVDENGVVTGHANGSTVITATSNLDPSFSVSCEVHVESLKITVNGTLQDADGNPMFYSWNLETDDTWTPGTAIDTSMSAATYSTGRDAYYIIDAVNGTWGVHLVDETGTSTEFYTNTAGVPLWDIAYSEYFSEVSGEEAIHAIYNSYLLPAKNPTGLDTKAFNLSTHVNYLAAVTSLGYEAYTDSTGVVRDAEHLILLEGNGEVTHLWLYLDEGNFSAELVGVASDLPVTFPGYNNLEQCYSSLVAGDDGNLYLSAFNGETNELYRLSYDENTESYVSVGLGDVGQDVWPATVTSVTSNVPVENNNVFKPVATDSITAQTISVNEIAASVDARSAKAEMLSDSETAADEKTVTVNVTASEAATNGVMDITWDADVLELVSYVPAASYNSVVKNENGMTFGYVALTPFAENDTVISLTFNVKATENTVVTVNNKQLNNAAGAIEEIAVTFEHGNTEIRNAKDATCTEPGYTGDVYCVDCGKLLEQGTVIEPSCPSAKFSDVPVGSWYHDAVDYVVANGLMAGMSESVFAPGLELNRAQIVTILYALAGAPEVTAPAAFTDVPADSYCADAVAWAAANGITAGISKNLFNPTGIVNRAEMVTFLYKYMKLADPEITVTGDLSAYTDAADVPNWAVEPMIWAVENGVISGVGDNTLAPAMNCNRAQMAVVLQAIAK